MYTSSCSHPAKHGLAACVFHGLSVLALGLHHHDALRTRYNKTRSKLPIEMPEIPEGLEIKQSKNCFIEPMSFPEFVQVYKRSYQQGSDEYNFRRGLYELHVAAAQMQNCKFNSRWTAGVNAHSDWTETELARLRGYKRTARARGSSMGWPSGSSWLPGVSSVQRLETSRANDLPESVSWAQLAAIGTPRDQGQCGSCWAHTAETVMRAHAELYGVAQNFSVEELISCVPNPQECGGQGGCKGATAELAYEYAMKHGLGVSQQGGGISQGWEDVLCPALESSFHPDKDLFFPDGREVHMLASANEERLSRHIGMHGWTKFPENREEPMVRALVELGPLAVAVAAGWQWNLYKAGIMSKDESCEDQVITHAVVLFGYGVEDGMRYWHLKNSWGIGWGESGNIRLQRLDEEEKVCSWDTKPEVGTGCLGGPPQVWVCGSCGILYDVSVPHFRKIDAPAREVEMQAGDFW